MTIGGGGAVAEGILVVISLDVSDGFFLLLFLLLFIYLSIRRAHVGPKANGRRARSISATQHAQTFDNNFKIYNNILYRVVRVLCFIALIITRITS
jgi:hypothetical protein